MTVTQRLFNPLFLCFSPFFRQFVAALSGFLAPRRRKRAQHGENERNLGEERPRQRVDKVWRWAQTTATTRWRGMIPTMRRRAPGWRCTLALTKPTLFHSAWINSKEQRTSNSKNRAIPNGNFPSSGYSNAVFWCRIEAEVGNASARVQVRQADYYPRFERFFSIFPRSPLDLWPCSLDS